MKSLILVTMWLSMSSLAFAQGALDEEVNAELDSLVIQSQQKRQAPAVQIQQFQAQQQVQKQPTTIIQASPLTESRAEQMRRARQEAELVTEQRIVEKLEQSRIEDEKRRSEALFGDKFNQMNTQPVQQAPVVVAPVAQPVVVAPAATTVVAPIAVNESSAALSDVVEKKKTEKKTYITSMGGMTSYPKAINVRGNYALGFGIGSKINDRILVEGDFLYSNYDVRQADNYYTGGSYYYGGYAYPRVTNLDQYAGIIAVKGQLLDGVIRPEVGGLLSYTFRQYKDRNQVIYRNDGSSETFDMGLTLGASMEMTESFEIGLEYRYMWNLSYKSNAEFDNMFWYSMYQNNNPLEKFNYESLLLTLRTTF